MTTLVCNISAIACATFILWRVEPIISRMGHGTYWMIRYALLMLAGGAIGIILTVLSGARIDFLTTLLLAGVALLIICERRLRFLANHRYQRGRHA